MLKRELRAVKREGREKVERIGKFFQYLNTLFVPLFVVFFGVYYNRRRNTLMQGRRISKDKKNQNKSNGQSSGFSKLTPEVNV